jgi:hypothetical protein
MICGVRVGTRLTEAQLASHFQRLGLLGTPEQEGYDLRHGYGTFHQEYRIDGHLMAGTRLAVAVAAAVVHMPPRVLRVAVGSCRTG